MEATFVSKSPVEPHPVFAEELASLAEKLAAAGQYTFAAEVLEIAASVTPRAEQLRKRISALKELAKTSEDPEREYKRRNLEASHAVGMARILEGRGELVRAQEMFDLAKLRAPFHYLAYAGAGYLHLRRRDLRAALEEFVQARRLNPLDRKLAVECARIALELEDYHEALRHAVDALLLTQGSGDSEETAARRRVETLGSLCRLSREELADLHRQRAQVLQRACDHVALTRARLFSAYPLVGLGRKPSRPPVPQEDLLRLALDVRRFKVFRHFTDAQLLQLVQVARREQYRLAQMLANEGQEDYDVFLILSGTVQVVRRTPVGTQVQATLTAGDLVGEVAFLDRRPRSSSLLVTEQATVLRWEAGELARLVQTNRELHAALLWSFWHALAGKVRLANAAMNRIIAPGRVQVRQVTAQTGEPIRLDPADKVALLREQGLSASELRLLATYSREVRFPPEALIFAEGQRGDELFIVVDGQVRISRHLPGLGEEALAILGRGEIFGEMALIDEEPRSADARAHLQGCTLFVVDRSRLEEVLDLDPDAACQFLGLMCQILCRRLRAMNDRLLAWQLMAMHQ
ncbi:MAG: cyclic nucleotide-binding domain-containing protein [Thermoanaerobaculum sp.]|nr:cyclic nucleotide-binding domain-containing protein [Thermoanaerobaculum sp.]